MKQKTLAKAITYSGNGLHSGLEVTMTLKPAPVGTGVVYVRKDLADIPSIHARPELVSSTVKATTIAENGAEVFTVEHLMAAFSMMEVDNVIVEMNSPEPPVTDGSAKVFCELIKQAGLVEQEAERQVYAVDREFSAYDKEKYIVVKPYEEYRISFTSINKHPLLGTQYFDITLTPESFAKEIMSARTVAFTQELEMLKKLGLGKGGTLENCVVFDNEKILSVPRFDNELIRHKILDVIGDLYLLGPIKAHVICVTTGHAFNSAVAKKIEEYRKGK
ncbi:MAG: UDP-3-O-[3-hydroxymyristoyl] N-acetylglucosamine deacetylase [Phascolarctobacterium sp.]|nr:UDP-3-O-[3-hydroxymyristoyl] N-acetylglucosamine deacetylase [Candidatus Phascolarctobacterium caballi]